MEKEGNARRHENWIYKSVKKMLSNKKLYFYILTW